MITPRWLWNSTATVLRHVQTVQNGEAVYADGARTTFKCRVQILSGEEALRAGGDRSKYLGLVHCDPDVDIDVTDHVVLSDGKEWFISSVRDPDAMHAFKVIDINRPLETNRDGL